MTICTDHTGLNPSLGSLRGFILTKSTDYYPGYWYEHYDISNAIAITIPKKYKANSCNSRCKSKMIAKIMLELLGGSRALAKYHYCVPPKY